MAIQIHGFQTNTTPGVPTIEIIEATNERRTTSFTVTIFPWGFAFSDLVAKVRDGNQLKPVVQVDNGCPVTLTWHGSVVDTGSYTIYYSNSQGQQTATPTTLGEWASPSLTADTVFTLVVTTQTFGPQLTASMSIAVAVKKPDLVAKSVTSQNLTVGSGILNTLVVSDGNVTIGSDASRPKLTVHSSPLVIDANANVTIAGNSLTFGAGTHKLVVDQTNGFSVTGNVRVGGSLTVTNGLKINRH